jgi:hypothetical protein
VSEEHLRLMLAGCADPVSGEPVGLDEAVIFSGLNDPWPIRKSLERSVAWLAELGVPRDEMQATLDLSSRMLVAARDSG